MVDDFGTGPEGDAARGVYGISVAAELVGIGVHTLRLYERRGLVEPDRTDGGTRRYSRDDLERLRRITALVEDGVNLAGVALVLQLQDENADLRRQSTPDEPSSEGEDVPPPG